MSVGRPRWTLPSTCSIACWTWDARTTSALRNLGRGWGQCGRTLDPCTTLTRISSLCAHEGRGSTGANAPTNRARRGSAGASALTNRARRDSLSMMCPLALPLMPGRSPSRHRRGPPLLDNEAALLLRCAGIHVPAPVEMIINLSRSSDHAAIQEHVEGRCLQVVFRKSPRPVILPEDGEQQRRNDRIHIDAEDVTGSPNIVECLDELPVESMEDVVLAPLLHELGDEPLPRIKVDRFAFEDRVMHARQSPRFRDAHLFRLRLLCLVGFGKARRHRLQVDPVAGIGRVL